MNTITRILMMTVAVTYNCFGGFDYDDEFNEGSVNRSYRPYQPHTIAYDKEKLLNNICNLKIEHDSLNIINANEKKKVPIAKSISSYNENSYSSLLWTPLQPNLNSVFVIHKTVQQDKTILQKNRKLNISFTFRI